jgi:hypothetical protein
MRHIPPVLLRTAAMAWRYKKERPGTKLYNETLEEGATNHESKAQNTPNS